MKPMITDTHKNIHKPDCKCSLCGQKYKSFLFKNGYVCESCINYIKDSYSEVCENKETFTSNSCSTDDKD